MQITLFVNVPICLNMYNTIDTKLNITFEVKKCKKKFKSINLKIYHK